MTELEIQEQRRTKWRIGRPARTVEDAAEFVESVGLSLVHPVRPPLVDLRAEELESLRGMLERWSSWMD